MTMSTGAFAPVPLSNGADNKYDCGLNSRFSPCRLGFAKSGILFTSAEPRQAEHRQHFQTVGFEKTYIMEL